MKKRTKVAILGATASIVAAFPALARAGSGQSNDPPETETPIVGVELDRATAAAIAHMGGGVVTGTEIEDEESYYEVEVTLADGSQVDVQLDEGFDVVGVEPDDESG